MWRMALAGASARSPGPASRAALSGPIIWNKGILNDLSGSIGEKATMNQYAKNLNRIAGCMERRAAMLGRQPRLLDIPEQISIRGSVFRKLNVNGEISSVRRIRLN